MRRTLSVLPYSFLLLFTWFSMSSFFGEEFGKAAYYADHLQGRKTASGEKYDKEALTCSHKTHPFGTKLRVTRMDNKRSVVVTVNDRGPFHDGFVVDLSRKAAEAIGLIKDGVTRVKVEVEAEADAATAVIPVAASTPTAPATTKTAPTRTKLIKAKQATAAATTAVKPVTYSTTSDPKPVSATTRSTLTAKGATAPVATTAPVVITAPKGTGGENKPTELFKVDIKKSVKKGFGVQVGTMSDADNVLPIVSKLQTQWPGKVLVNVDRNDTDDTVTYRIVLGPFSDKISAEKQEKLATKKGYPKCFVVDLSAM